MQTYVDIRAQAMACFFKAHQGHEYVYLDNGASLETVQCGAA